MSQILPVPRAADATGRIPLLDIGPYLAGAPGARAALAYAIELTCRDTGFLVIANHGIDQSLIDATFAAAAAFFDLPVKRKLALKVGDLNIGYLPYGAQIVRTSKVHVNTQPNLSESFYIVNDLNPDDPRILSGDPLYGLNKWPEELPEFKTATLAYMPRDAAVGGGDGVGRRYHAWPAGRLLRRQL